MSKKQIILTTTNILLLLFGFCLSSCKQESVPPPSSTTASPFYVQFKINNVLHTYTERVDSAVINYLILPDSLYFVDMDGYSAAGNDTASFISLGLSDSFQLATNVTYTNFSTSANGEQEVQYLNIMYVDSSGVVYSCGLPPYRPGRVKITEMTPFYVKAIFSATLYHWPDTIQTVGLTDGELYMKRTQ